MDTEYLVIMYVSPPQRPLSTRVPCAALPLNGHDDFERPCLILKILQLTEAPASLRALNQKQFFQTQS